MGKIEWTGVDLYGLMWTNAYASRLKNDPFSDWTPSMRTNSAAHGSIFPNPKGVWVVYWMYAATCHSRRLAGGHLFLLGLPGYVPALLHLPRTNMRDRWEAVDVPGSLCGTGTERERPVWQVRRNRAGRERLRGAGPRDKKWHTLHARFRFLVHQDML